MKPEEIKRIRKRAQSICDLLGVHPHEGAHNKDVLRLCDHAEGLEKKLTEIKEAHDDTHDEVEAEGRTILKLTAMIRKLVEAGDNLKRPKNDLDVGPGWIYFDGLSERAKAMLDGSPSRTPNQIGMQKDGHTESEGESHSTQPHNLNIGEFIER